MAGSYTISLRSIRASEYTLNVPRAATVGLLKARITETFPGSPAPDMQRLVFAGRLLSDASEPLEKVFAGWDDSLPLAVHLVIRSSVAPAPASPASAPAAVPIPQQNPGGWQQYPGNVGRFGPQAAMRPQMAQAAPQQAAAPRGHSFSLMLKLAFFVFILSQNSGYQRKLFFGAIAVVLYLYHIGWIRFQAHVHVFQAQRPANNNAAQAPAGAAAGPAAPAPPAPPSAETLLAAFVFSLLPTWQPPAAANNPPPGPAAAAAA